MDNVIERARELVRLGDGAIGDNWWTTFDHESDSDEIRCKDGWIADVRHDEIGKFIVYSRNHAPDIANALIEAVEMLKRYRQMCLYCDGDHICSQCYDTREFLNRIGVHNDGQV